MTTYTIDRYLCTQEADLWTQCFVWWYWRSNADGTRTLLVGVCVDRRVGFGGAFAPNRYERVALLVTAIAQRMQAAFDDTQPLPAHARRWEEARCALQERGELPPGVAQRHPRYIQAYIDDVNGARRAPENVAQGKSIPMQSLREHQLQQA